MSAKTERKLRALRPLIAWGLAHICVVAPAHAESAFGPTQGSVERIDAPDKKNRGADGVYGRFNGDLSLSIGGGLEANFEHETFRPLILGSLAFYQTAALYSSFRQGLGEDDPVDQIVSLGLEVSPLFIWRWSRAWEQGPAFWDLTLDSLTLSGGVALTNSDEGGLFEDPRSEWGLGFGVPLMGRANGLWLRTRAQITPQDELETSAFVWLSWQGFVHAGVLRTD